MLRGGRELIVRRLFGPAPAQNAPTISPRVGPLIVRRLSGHAPARYRPDDQLATPGSPGSRSRGRSPVSGDAARPMLIAAKKES